MRRVGGFHFIEKSEAFSGDMVADRDIIGVGGAEVAPDPGEGGGNRGEHDGEYSQAAAERTDATIDEA